MSGTIPTWLERWLGIEPSGSGEGTAWELDHSLAWAPWVVLLFVVVAVVWTVYHYIREIRAFPTAGVAAAVTGLLSSLLALALAGTLGGLLWIGGVVLRTPYIGTMDIVLSAAVLLAGGVLWGLYFLAWRWIAGGGLVAVLPAVRTTAVLIVAFVMIAELMINIQRTELPYVVIMVDVSRSMDHVDRYRDDQLRAELERRVKVAGLDGASRINLAKALLLEDDGHLLDAIERKYKLKVYFVAGDVAAQAGDRRRLVESISTAAADGEASRLGDAIRSVLADLRGTPPAAIILLSDGITTDGETITDAAAYARRKNVPLLAVGLGSDQPDRNLKLTDLSVDDAVFVGDVLGLEATLSGTGYGGQTVRLTLREEGESAVLAEKQATIVPGGGPQPVRLTYRPTRPGEMQLVMEVEHLPDEVNDADNRPPGKKINVHKDKIKVLLVQAYPNYEFRYLKHLLGRIGARRDEDEPVELNVVLQQADLDYPLVDPTARRLFPVNRDELFKYHVIIFGDVDPSFLSTTAMQNISDFVQVRGGGIVFLCGPRYTPHRYANTPLADLFPVDLGAVRLPDPAQPQTEGFVVRPTETGLNRPAMQLGDSPGESAQIWSNLPPLYWMLEAPLLKSGAHKLATHPTRLGSGGPLPVICEQYVGAGKVLMHTTDETWRWRYRVGDVFFARYWIQTLRYLGRSKALGGDASVSFTADPKRQRLGKSVRLRVRFRDEKLAPPDDDGVTVMIEQEGRPNRRLTLHRHGTNRGVFEGLLTKPPAGTYRAWVVRPVLEGKPPEVEIHVESPEGEDERMQMDAAELRRGTDLTKGKFYRFAESATLLDDLPDGRLIPMDPLPPHSIWDKWWVLLPLLCLLIGEWLLRKKKGML